jgi:hypothetical protein
MIKTLLKGEGGLAETQSFAASFPLASDPDAPTILSVDAFDAWAVHEGYYSDQCDQDTLVNLRNRLRNKINHTAANDAWSVRGHVPFHVQVRTFGKDYVITSAEDAFNSKAMRLPAQIRSVATTKHRALKELRDRVDFGNLPVGLQVRVDQLGLGIERYVDDIDYATKQINRQFVTVQAQVAQLVNAKKLAPTPLLDILDEATEDA